MGYTVDIFEAKDKPSGLTVYGIAPYKITNEEVLDEVSYLQDQLGFNISYNAAIKTKEQLTEMENNYDAIFVGVGLGPTAYRNIPGEDKEEVYGAVEFVEDLRMNHHATKVGEKVVVLGAGNTAMDVASESARMGASKVVLTYRGSKEKMGAYGFEYDLALSAGVQSIFDASPAEILGNDKVEGVRFTRSDGSDFTIECDMVIKATGQSKQGGLYALIDALELDDSSIVKVNPENNQTTNEKYFAGGDAINGGAEVVNAAYDGKLAANGIHQWLNQ
jgi:glutamate synthase (NADPH/NADH) small chain